MLSGYMKEFVLAAMKAEEAKQEGRVTRQKLWQAQADFVWRLLMLEVSHNNLIDDLDRGWL